MPDNNQRTPEAEAPEKQETINEVEEKQPEDEQEGSQPDKNKEEEWFTF